MRVPVSLRLALVVAVVGVCIQSVDAAGQTYWVGYQDGCGGELVNGGEASFHDGNQWFGFVVPGASDDVSFDDRYDPQANGVPHMVHFGDFEVDVVGVGCQDHNEPGADAIVDDLRFDHGDFAFDLGGQRLAFDTLRLSDGELVRPGIYSQAGGLSLSGGGVAHGRLVIVGDYDNNANAGSLEVSGPGTVLQTDDDVEISDGSNLHVHLGGQIQTAAKPDAVLTFGRNDGGATSGASGVIEHPTTRVEVGSFGVSGNSVLEVKDGASIATSYYGSVVQSSKLVLSRNASALLQEHVSVGSGGLISLSHNSSLTAKEIRVLSGEGPSMPGGMLDASGSAIASSGVMTVRGDAILAAGSVADVGDALFVSGLNSTEASLDIGGPTTVVTAVGQLAAGHWVTTGETGAGRVVIHSGARLVTGKVGSGSGSSGVLGTKEGSLGDVSIVGYGSQWNQDGVLGVGFGGEGMLAVSAGGSVTSESGVIGRLETASGKAVIGSDSSWSMTGSLLVGGLSETSGGYGELVVDVGGAVQASDVTIWSRGVLSGSGEIVGDVNVFGLLTPGSSPGRLSVDGSLTLGSTSTTRIEIAGAAAGRYDQLAVNGPATLGGVLEVSFIEGFYPFGNQAFELFLASNIAGDFNRVDVAGLPDDVSYVFERKPGGFVLTTMGAIPEPSAMALLGIGLAALGARCLRSTRGSECPRMLCEHLR